MRMAFIKPKIDLNGKKRGFIPFSPLFTMFMFLFKISNFHIEYGFHKRKSKFDVKHCVKSILLV